MCGILLGLRANGHNVSKAVRKRYEKQRGRGTEGFGYIAIDKGKVKHVERSEYEEPILRLLKNENSPEILFHHRHPTSTPNYEEATHPIVVDNNMLKHKYYIIHNGVLQNEDYLKKQHEALGFTYTTEYEHKSLLKFKDKSRELSTTETGFNDSESMAIDFALFIEGHNKSMESRGSIAFIALQCDKENSVKKIIYGHNSGSPMMVEDTTKNKEGMFFIKSSGNGIAVPEDKIYVLDYKTREIEVIDAPVGIPKNVSKPILHPYETDFDDDPYNNHRAMGYGHASRQQPSLPPPPKSGVHSDKALSDEEYNERIEKWMNGKGSFPLDMPRTVIIEEERDEPSAEDLDWQGMDGSIAFTEYKELSRNLRKVREDIAEAEAYIDSASSTDEARVWEAELRASQQKENEILDYMDDLKSDFGAYLREEV
jgi:predicted glutamine amidotransferase